MIKSQEEGASVSVLWVICVRRKKLLKLLQTSHVSWWWWWWWWSLPTTNFISVCELIGGSALYGAIKVRSLHELLPVIGLWPLALCGAVSELVDLSSPGQLWSQLGSIQLLQVLVCRASFGLFQSLSHAAVPPLCCAFINIILLSLTMDTQTVFLMLLAVSGLFHPFHLIHLQTGSH